MKKRMNPALLRDAHAYGGAGLVAFGAWLIYPPAAAVVYGAFLAWLGLFYGRARK